MRIGTDALKRINPFRKKEIGDKKLRCKHSDCPDGDKTFKSWGELRDHLKLKHWKVKA